MDKESRNTQKVEEEQHKLSAARMNIVLFMMLFIDLLGFTVILPLMPRMLEFYGKDGTDGLYAGLKDVANNFRDITGAPDTPKWNSVLFGGIIGSLFSLLQFMASPFIGALSDVYGRRPVMLFTMVGIAFSYVIWALSNNFTLFVVARIIGGLAKGNVSLSMAVVADIYKPEERGKGMALVGIAFSLGFLLGPLIGAGFAGSNVKILGFDEFFVAPALFSLTMAVVDIMYIFCAFSETLPKSKRMPSLLTAQSKAIDLINPISLFMFKPVSGASAQESGSMRWIGCIYFLYLMLYSGLEFTLTFFTHLRFNYTNMQQGKMFFILGLIMILVQATYTRRRASGTEKKTAMVGIVALIPGWLCIGFSKSALLFYTGLALFAFASGTVVSCMTTMISGYGKDSQKGAVLGVFRALGALARALGPVIASAAFWSLGAEITYCIGAAGLLIPLSALYLVKLHENKPVKATQ